MKAWEDLLRSLESTLGSKTVEKWLKPISVSRFDAANIYLKATPFQKAWFEEHAKPIARSIFTYNQRPITIHWEQDSSPSKNTPTLPSYKISQDSLDPEFTLDSFLNSPANDLGYKMALELTKASSPIFNPVFYFGPPGSGKTHLLSAIAQTLQKKNQKVFYITAQTFMEHVVHAMRLGAMQQFRKTYRNIDAFIVDDIHTLARKNATQEEFFHTFNTLHTLNKQIILSANDSPIHLKEIEPRLISRFEVGIAASLTPPDGKLFLTILQEKAKSLELEAPKELFTFLIERFPSSIKAPIEALHSLALHASKITSTSQAETLLFELLNKEKRSEITTKKIIEDVAAHFGIKAEDLTGKSQMREFVKPRQVAMYFCRLVLQVPFQQIGYLFSRDHSTAISSIRQIEKALLTKDSTLLKSIDAIAKNFQSSFRARLSKNALKS